MKLTMKQILTMNLKSYRNYVRNLKNLTAQELREEYENYSHDFANACEMCRKEKGILRIPPYWMQARAQAAAEELCKR